MIWDIELATIDENEYCPECGNIVTYTDDGQECFECGWNNYEGEE